MMLYVRMIHSAFDGVDSEPDSDGLFNLFLTTFSALSV